MNLVLAIYDWCKYSRRLWRTSVLMRGVPLSKAIIWQILRDNRKTERDRMYFSIIYFEIAYRLSIAIKITKLLILNDLEWLNDRQCALSLWWLIFHVSCTIWPKNCLGHETQITETLTIFVETRPRPQPWPANKVSARWLLTALFINWQNHLYQHYIDTWGVDWTVSTSVVKHMRMFAVSLKNTEMISAASCYCTVFSRV